MDMFCYQCEQTAKGTGCTKKGVCGKEPEAAALMDILLHTTIGLARYGRRGRALGVQDESVDLFVLESLFSTVTNVSFDTDRLEPLIRKAVQHRSRMKEHYEQACKKAGQTPERLDGAAAFNPAKDRALLLAQAEALGIEARRRASDETRVGLEELVLYGLKGTAAYADHAWVLGQRDPAVMSFFYEALDFLGTPHTVDELVQMSLRVGAINLRVMELLDAANTGTYGHPEPTRARITPKKGKAILVSGHDLQDLAALLEQTKGRGINVYTHGEMLPALAYPGLKRYPHLIGNYGSAWQEQKKEFSDFPGAILMTTNCIQKPDETYRGRIFTTGLVSFPGVRHIDNKDFTPVIEAALTAKGFQEDSPEQHITVGFGRNAVLAAAPKVIELVKSGKIKKFFLVGGCDGAKSGRSYYTDFVKASPKDSLILTLACGKYRFNKLDFGDIEGIPRLLDIGQCNDAYSAIQIAVALAQAFGTDVNSLPLSMVLSWYEQKAVAILLTLLHLGIKNIRLGPSLPAFVTPPVLNVLVEKFQIAPITTPEADLKTLCG